MPSKWSAVEERVRKDISDAKAVVRWTTPELLNWFTDGRRELVGIRPEAQYVSDVTTGEPAVVAAVTEDIGVTETFLPALVHYADWRALMKDGEDSPNRDLAEYHRQQFQMLARPRG